MEENQNAAARRCLHGAETDAMTFPDIVKTLIEADFEGYAVDYRQACAIYHLPDGDCVSLPIPRQQTAAAAFNIERVRAAILEAQSQAPGYTYAGFCRKVVAAGCAGYIVSFLGRRVVYYGRTAETHVEYF